MKTTSTELTQLHARMEKIERQNARLKRAILALVGCLLALGLMGAKVGMKEGHFSQITTGRISIIDPSGKEIITIGSQEGIGTGIRFFNKDGKRIIGLGLTADEMGSGILVADNDGKPRLGLGMDKGVPSIAMADGNGKKIMALGGDNNGYGLVIMDGNEVQRAGVGFKEGSTGIVIYNDQGKYVRGMVQKADGTNFSSYVDTTGNEVFLK